MFNLLISLFSCRLVDDGYNVDFSRSYDKRTIILEKGISPNVPNPYSSAYSEEGAIEYLNIRENEKDTILKRFNGQSIIPCCLGDDLSEGFVKSNERYIIAKQQLLSKIYNVASRQAVNKVIKDMESMTKKQCYEKYGKDGYFFIHSIEKDIEWSPLTKEEFKFKKDSLQIDQNPFMYLVSYINSQGFTDDINQGLYKLRNELKAITDEQYDKKYGLYRYWILEKHKNIIYGPLSKESFENKLDSLQIDLEL